MPSYAQRILIFVLLVHFVVLANTNQDTASNTISKPGLVIAPKSSIVDSSKERPSSIVAMPKVYSKETPIEEKIQYLAQTIAGVALVGCGLAYWTHFSASNNFAQRNGINTLILPIAATVAIPIGTAISFFSVADLIGSMHSNSEE
jgi:hypothetical protein